jgi:transcriptional antiterminator RfaH
MGQGIQIMGSEREPDYIPRWYAIYTHPRQEDRAESNLRAWGVETFNPKVKESRRNPYTHAPIQVIKNLFPRYFFARFEAGEMLRKICFTRGVQSVVSFGNGPTPIDDKIITVIKSRVGKDNFIKLDEDFKFGDKVTIKDGPLRNFTGVFDREIKNSDRVRILLAAISYEGHVIIEKDLIKKVTTRSAAA